MSIQEAIAREEDSRPTSAETTADRTRQVIADTLGLQKADIKPEQNIVTDLGADSLDSVELLMDLEDTFSVEITDKEGAAARTVQQVIDLVLRKVYPFKPPVELRRPA